ncbi:MAG: cobalamin biosynthesis protein CobD [Synergistaceae bacterium]|nr:cobalamin biosynthesis protein CobD [Synergistaceae bacterium]
MNFALTLCISLLLDEIIGDPVNFPHPVKLIGHLIFFLKSKLFTDTHSFIRGLVLCSLTLITTGLAVYITLYITDCNIIIQIYMLYSATAWRDLKDETLPVVFALMNHDIESSRKFLSRVVGRDTENMNEHEITRAVIETIAENSVDGIMSLMFFAALGYALNRSYGMALSVWLFKAASTLDSMTGYECYHEFGKAGARLDDILNFIPARLGGLIIILAGILTGHDAKSALRVFIHDRKKHKSPNSAHSESAFAGVLCVRLGGGAFYDGKFESRPYINACARDPEIYDVFSAYKLLDVSCALFAFMIILLTWTI